MNERVMVLAAGMGARLMPLTDNISKPMVPIVNRPVMEHTIRLLARQGFEEIIVNLHYLPRAISDYFGDGSRWGLSIEYSEEERLMGTAGGVKLCERFLGTGTFLVVSGDALTDVELPEMLEYHRGKKALATMMVTAVEDVSKFGIVCTEVDGLVTGFQEKPAEAEVAGNSANSGIYIFEPALFDMIPSDRPYDFGRELFPELVARGDPLYAWSHGYYWNDVGGIEEYQRGNFDALAGHVRLDIPGVEVSPGVWVGSGTRIGKDVQVTPPVCIGDRCVIEERARLVGPLVIGPDTVVSAGANLHRGIKWGGGYIGRDASVTGSIVGSQFRIGDGAAVEGVILGSGCVVEDGIKIDPSVKIVTDAEADSDS